MLERSPDLGPERGGGSNGNSGRSQPPVLRRSGDDSSGDDAPPPTSPSPRDRRGGESGGQPQSGGEPQSDTIKLDATLVDIPVVVSDRSGRFIPRLTKNDFYVTEDGVQQQVAFFGSEEVPFNVALLLDVSPSVSNSARDIQDAALAFINELRPEDKVMIVAFDERVRFLTDFTNDRREMTYAIENTRTGNGTSVYEAVYDTVANRLKYVQGRKAMILFSDGEDTTSRRVKYQDAIDLVSESDVLVYGLRYPDTGGYGPNVGFPRTRMPFPLPGTRLPFPFPFPWPGKGPWGHFDSGGNSSGGGASYWNGQWGRRGGG
ncbi:MAG: VWA domain-containing protein, partial [Blastocatellia bacterium]